MRRQVTLTHAHAHRRFQRRAAQQRAFIRDHICFSKRLLLDAQHRAHQKAAGGGPAFVKCGAIKSSRHPADLLQLDVSASRMSVAGPGALPNLRWTPRPVSFS